MRFDYNVTKAAYIRQRGRCAKCGKYLNMIYEDGRGHEGAWTAHALMPLDEGGSNKAHNCVILCITEPDCHLNVAHEGDPHKHVFLTQYSFPNWVFSNSA
jgi:5-methylcytosine-specific restriction endonuclease McrA